MSSTPSSSAAAGSRGNGIPRVIVATTALLTFISFWRAAAIVLNDLASSAYYAGGEAEGYIGKTAPWFILAIMLFSYAVRAVYVESCSMFVRGGVYRAVKQSLGGTLAKFSVSALMFDYILTGPISGVSAGQYLGGLLSELSEHAHLSGPFSQNTIAAIATAFAIVVTLYFWWENTKGIPESSEKALHIMKLVTVMVVLLIGWCIYTAVLRHSSLPPFPYPRNLRLGPSALGWLAHSSLPHMFGIVAIFIALGHSVLAMSGEESLAQVYREIESPKLPNLKKAGLVIFIYSLVFTSLVSFFAVMIIPDDVRQNYLQNLIGGLAMSLHGPLVARLIFHGFVVVVGTLILAGAVNTAIVGSNGVLNRESLRLRRHLELHDERPRRSCIALHAPRAARVPGAAELCDSRSADPRGARTDYADSVLDRRREPFHQACRDRGRRHFFGDFVRCVHHFRAPRSPWRRCSRRDGSVQPGTRRRAEP